MQPRLFTNSRKRPADRDTGTDTPAIQGHKKPIKKLHGECPPYNDKACWVGDPFEGKTYMFGGEKPDEEETVPTSDLYCLDTVHMTWKNLTNSLKFRRPYAPMSRDECTREARELPQLSLPACTLHRSHDTSFLLIFGGFDVEEEVPSSTLIIVSLRHHEWWFADIQGGPVAGRINPTIVSIERNLYIFGGYKCYSGDGSPHESYCIAELSDDGSTWNWKARDVPYTPDVPKGTIFGMATPVCDGYQILLTPWRTVEGGSQTSFTFTKRNTFCFHIKRQQFKPGDFTGDVPEGIEWYFTYPLDAPFNPANPLPTLSHKRRGRPPKYPKLEQPSQTVSISSQQRPTTTKTSSVLICGWVEERAELWHLELTHSESFTKLNIGPITREVGHSMETSMLLGNRFWLLGSRNAPNRSEVDSVSDRESDPAVKDWNYDIYLDIPLTFMDTI